MACIHKGLSHYCKRAASIAIATAIWGTGWANKSVLCRCNNEAVVSIINFGTSKDPTVMCLIRCLYFIAAKFNLLISAVHLAGSANGLADALSRNNRVSFLINHPQANHLPSPIPAELLDLLVHSKPDWISPSCSKMFNSIFNQPSPQTQCVPTPLAIADTAISVHVLESNPTLHPRMSSASLLDTLDSSDSSTKPSNVISQASDSFRSGNRSQTPFSMTPQDFIMSSAELSPSKQRKITQHANASQ